MKAKSGTVLENAQWKIKIYTPPKEHGPVHVHVVAKGEKAEVKIELETLTMKGRTRFSKKTVRGIIRYIHQNYDFLMDHWEKLNGKKKKTQSKKRPK